MLLTAASEATASDTAVTQALAAVGTVVAVLVGLLAILDRFRKWIDKRIVTLTEQLTKRVDATDNRLLDHEQRISRLEGKQENA